MGAFRYNGKAKRFESIQHSIQYFARIIAQKETSTTPKKQRYTIDQIQNPYTALLCNTEVIGNNA